MKFPFSSEQRLPSFTELYRYFARSTKMNMSLERTFSESTDTASEMLYDSFDQDNFLSSESFDMEDTCFLDDITEEDITACISNDQQVQSFDYILWMKKLAGLIGGEYENDKKSELATIVGAIEYIRYLKWCLDFTSDSTSPQSVCSFSSIELDYSPKMNISTDLNATFRRKLSFGGNETPISDSRTSQNGGGNTKPSNVFDPSLSQSLNYWRYEEETQTTLLGYQHNTNYDDTSDMSFTDDTLGNDKIAQENRCFNPVCNEDANFSFMDQQCKIINNDIYSSLQQMCLVQEGNSSNSVTNLPSNNDTSSSGNEGPTEEDLIQFYCQKYPALSSLLASYSSDESDDVVDRKPKRKQRIKQRTRRRNNKKTDINSPEIKIQGDEIESTISDTQIAEVDSTTTIENKSMTISTQKINKRSGGLKRPKNGFIRFSIEYRKVLAEKHPNLDNRDVSKMLGHKWRKMTPEDRKPYEEEFAHDLEEMKKQNPSWKYTAQKRTGHDEIEPMPSRLRPRDKLKRKFSPYLIKTLSTKRRRLSPRVKAKTSRKGAIMKCTICSKYQQIYGVPAKNLVNLRALWFCGLNPDPKNNTCLQNVAMTTRSSMDLSSAATITTSGPFTSVVSRYCSSSSARPAAIPQRIIHSAQNSCRPTFRYIASHPHKLIKHSEQVVPMNGLSHHAESFPSAIPTSQQLNGVSERPNMTVNSSRNTLYSGVADVLNNSTPLKQYVSRGTLDSMHAACDAPIDVSTSKVLLTQNTSVIGKEPNNISSSFNEQNLNSRGDKSSIGTNEKPVVYSRGSSATEGLLSKNSDYDTFISFIPTQIPFQASQAGVNMPSLSTTNTTQSSTISLSSTNTAPLPTPGPYITVIPKSVWNTIASDTLNQIIAQQNLK